MWFPILALLLMSCEEHDVGGHTAEMVFSDPQVRAVAKAACAGDEAEVRRLVGGGVSPNARGDKNFTPLLWALTCRSERGMIALLDAGADPNQAGADGIFPIRVAATYDDPKFLKLLLARGGNPNMTDPGSNDTPLMTALAVGVERGEWKNYYALLDAGADINLEYKGSTIASMAVNLGRFDKAIELVERGYSYDLNRIALGTHIRRVASAQGKANQRQFIELLKAKGVPFDALAKEWDTKKAQAEQENEAYQQSLLHPPASPEGNGSSQ